MGVVAFGEQTVPSGIAALADRDDAGLGRHPRPGLPRRAAAAAGDRRASRSGSSAWPSSSAAAFGGDRRARPGRARGPDLLADRLGDRLAVRLAPRRLPRRPLVATGLQMLSGGLVLAAMASASGELGDVRRRRRDSRLAPRPRLPDRRRQPGRVHRLRAGCSASGAPAPVTTYAFVNPVVAVFLGWLILDESVDADPVVAGAVIVVGVALSDRLPDRMRRLDPPPSGAGRRRRRGDRGRLRRMPSAPARSDRPRSARRAALGQHRPGDAPGEGHDRDHRVDTDAGREQRAIPDVEPGDDGAAAGPDPARRIARRGRGPAPSGRCPSGGPRRQRAPVGPEVERRRASSNTTNARPPGRREAGPAGQRGGVPRRRSAGRRRPAPGGPSRRARDGASRSRPRRARSRSGPGPTRSAGPGPRRRRG